MESSSTVFEDRNISVETAGGACEHNIYQLLNASIGNTITSILFSSLVVDWEYDLWKWDSVVMNGLITTYDMINDLRAEDFKESPYLQN